MPNCGGEWTFKVVYRKAWEGLLVLIARLSLCCPYIASLRVCSAICSYRIHILDRFIVETCRNVQRYELEVLASYTNAHPSISESYVMKIGNTSLLSALDLHWDVSPSIGGPRIGLLLRRTVSFLTVPFTRISKSDHNYGTRRK
jgi:hypothetical protein